MQKNLESSSLTDKKLTTEKYFLDTNMLIYLVNKSEVQKQEQINDFIKSKLIYLSIQTLKEFANIMLTKTNLSPKEIREYLITFSKKFILLPEISTDILSSIEFTTNRNNFYDGLLVATMKRNKIDQIITENEKDFMEFAGIKVINPFK